MASRSPGSGHTLPRQKIGFADLLTASNSGRRWGGLWEMLMKLRLSIRFLSDIDRSITAEQFSTTGYHTASTIDSIRDLLHTRCEALITIDRSGPKRPLGRELPPWKTTPNFGVLGAFVPAPWESFIFQAGNCPTSSSSSELRRSSTEQVHSKPE